MKKTIKEHARSVTLHVVQSLITFTGMAVLLTGAASVIKIALRAIGWV